MTLESRILSLTNAVGADVKVLYGKADKDIVTVSLQNTDAQIIRLKPVYKKENGSIGLASDSALTTSKVYGLVYDTSIGNNTFGNIVINGIIDVSESVWLSNLGLNLVAGQQYFLKGSSIDIVPDMTSTAVVRLGTALSSTRFKIEIEEPIIL